MKKTSHWGIYENEQKLYTRSIVPGACFGESLVKIDDVEYRHFDPMRSKVAAAVKKKITATGVKERDFVLYLGASHGYTVSFLSDIIGPEGIIFAVDNAYKVFRSLFYVSNARHNIVPIYADAAQPAQYVRFVCGVDTVYQDVAQKGQVDIFDENFSLYAKDDALGILVVKAHSIDVAAPPAKVIDGVKKSLLAKGYTIIDAKSLDPYQGAHAYIVVSKGEKKKQSRTRAAPLRVPQQSGQE